MGTAETTDRCDCIEGERCVDCGGCPCGYYESTCSGPPGSPEGCLSVDAAEQYRTEFGSS